VLLVASVLMRWPVKKEIDVKKDLFKRVSSEKKTREFSISERTKSTNKHQAAADFVASQTRTSNTKGQESELAKDWDRFSTKDVKRATKESSSVKTSEKPKIRKLNAAQRAQIESHKLAQKRALRSTSTSITPEASSNDTAASKAELGGRRPSGAGSASLEGKAFDELAAGQADMGHHVDGRTGSASLEGKAFDELAAGQADMGHHVDGRTGLASLEGKEFDESAAGQADMGHHVDGRVGSASLEGKEFDESAAGQADMGHHVDGQAGLASLEGKEFDESAAGQADMGHHAQGQAGLANIEGKERGELAAGQADMGHHAQGQAGLASIEGKEVDELAAGQADMGHHVGGQAGLASLEGKEFGELAAGQADMGHHVDGQAGLASLEGNAPEAEAGTVDMGHHDGVRSASMDLSGQAERSRLVGQANIDDPENIQASDTHLQGSRPTSTKSGLMKDVEGTVTGEERPKTASSGRLAEKMSKIRSQSADITMDSETLKERNDKP